MKNLEHLNNIIKQYGMDFDEEDTTLLEEFIENNSVLLYFSIEPHFTEDKGIYDHATITLAGSNDLYELDLNATITPDILETAQYFNFEEN